MSLINDPLYTDWKDLSGGKRNSSTSSAIVVDLKHYFLGYSQAAKFFRISLPMAQDYLKRKENWSRFDELTEQEKAQIPNLESQMQKVTNESTSFARKILIRIIHRNKIYFLRLKNIYQAAEFLKKDEATVQRNCNNQSVKQVMWEEDAKSIKKKVIDLDQLPIYDHGLIYNQTEAITSSKDENGNFFYLIIPSRSAKRYVSQTIAKSVFSPYFPVQKHIVYDDSIDINSLDDSVVKLHYLSSPDYRYTEDQSPVTDKEILAELAEKGFIVDEALSNHDFDEQILDSKLEITPTDSFNQESDHDLEIFDQESDRDLENFDHFECFDQ